MATPRFRGPPACAGLPSRPEKSAHRRAGAGERGCGGALAPAPKAADLHRLWRWPAQVPLVSLALVACRLEPLDLGFELFLLEEMLPDALAGGQEGYCVCTLQVATCFLRQLQLPPTTGPG